MSTNRKVSETGVCGRSDVCQDARKVVNLPKGLCSVENGDKVYFANRLRRASESTKPYFGARKGTVEAFV